MQDPLSKRVFVTGAGGFIGSAVCRAAVAAGFKVAGLFRPSFTASGVSGVRRVLGTLPYDIPPEALEVDVVIHCAALTKSGDPAEARAVTVDGTAFLLMLAKASGRRPKFIFVSSQSAIMANSSDYAVSKREAEELVRKSGLDYAIVRPGLVYGPGNAGLYSRMRKLALSFPVIPVPGNGQAVIQPVHVDDLVRVLLHPKVISKDDNLELNIGDQPITLEELLRVVEKQAKKRPRPLLRLPLGPIKAAADAATKVGLKLPISKDNLQGLEAVEIMETESSLKQLGLVLRPFGKQDQADAPEMTSDSRLPVLLIGAGKVGIIHAITLLHHPDARLAGIVEPHRKAWNLYRGIGIKVPFYKALSEAVAASGAKAAIVATPADTHLQVAAECLKAGLSVLTEKPSSVRVEQLAQWSELRAAHPEKTLHVGYMAAQMPHVETARSLLVSGAIGRVTGVSVVSVQTHIMSSTPVRWEMQKQRAGGGVFINFGCHSLSILQRLFGLPESFTGNCWSIYSQEVEDAVVAHLDFEGFGCDFFSCWSMPDYARPALWIEVRGQIGTLILDYFGLAMSRGNETTWIDGQPDVSLPFNFSPDYTGAGFWQEHDAFVRAVRKGKQDPQHSHAVDLSEAGELERWIFDFYKKSSSGFPTKEVVTDRRITDLIKCAKPAAKGGVRRDLA